MPVPMWILSGVSYTLCWLMFGWMLGRWRSRRRIEDLENLAGWNRLEIDRLSRALHDKTMFRFKIQEAGE